MSLLPAGHDKGLIIPIIIRGSLPDTVRGNRQAYSMNYVDAKDLRTRRARMALQQVAEDIFNRHEAFRSAAGDPCAMCDDFEFPSEDDISDWLAGVTAPAPRMPWRR